MALVTDPALDVLDQLIDLRSKLANNQDQSVRNKALQLSKNLASSLSHPASAAVDLAFAVSCHLLITVMILPRLTETKHTALSYCFCENCY